MGIQRRGSLKIIDLAETKGEAPVNNILHRVFIKNYSSRRVG